MQPDTPLLSTPPRLEMSATALAVLAGTNRGQFDAALRSAIEWLQEVQKQRLGNQMPSDETVQHAMNEVAGFFAAAQAFLGPPSTPS